LRAVHAGAAAAPSTTPQVIKAGALRWGDRSLMDEEPLVELPARTRPQGARRVPNAPLPRSNTACAPD